VTSPCSEKGSSSRDRRSSTGRFLKTTCKPRNSRRVPREAAERPLPSELTTRCYKMLLHRVIFGNRLPVETSRRSIIRTFSNVSTPGEPLPVMTTLILLHSRARALLERLRAFEGATISSAQSGEEITRVTVNALMAKKLCNPPRWPAVWRSRSLMKE